MTRKKLNLKIRKENLQINYLKTVRTQTKYMKKNQKEIKMTCKHMERCLILLVMMYKNKLQSK